MQALLLEFETKEERRSLNWLPADVLTYIFELSVSRLEEVAPLARVSKLFNTCVKSTSVLRILELRTSERLKRLFPDLDSAENHEEDRAAGSVELVSTLHRVRSGYPAIGGIDLGNDGDSNMVKYVADKHVRLVASFPGLRSVSLERCLSVTDISPLQSLTALTKLNLYRCNSILGSSFVCLSSLTSLQELNVGFTVIDDEGLAGLSRSLTALTKLSLRYCESISGAGFARLSSLTSLQELNGCFTTINDEGLAGLSRSLPALTKLNLYWCSSISGSGFARLSSLTSLQELDVGDNVINDEGLAGLSRSLTALTKLDLRYCESISGTGFACLSSLTSLQELDVRYTAISGEVLAGLRRSLPALTIDCSQR